MVGVFVAVVAEWPRTPSYMYHLPPSLQSDSGLHSHYLQRLSFSPGCLSSEWPGGKATPTNANYTSYPPLQVLGATLNVTLSSPWPPGSSPTVSPRAVGGRVGSVTVLTGAKLMNGEDCVLEAEPEEQEALVEFTYSGE